MTLHLQEINVDNDFPALARCMFESYEDPPQKFFHIFFPTHGTNAEAREEAIAEAADRLKLWHTPDPSSYWRKVVDSETGNIAGGALWKIHRENPFASPSAAEVTWFPEGGSRAYVEQALQLHSAPRARVAQRAHVCVGQQFMDWGMRKADELRLEIFLDSTPYGKRLYEANNFVSIEENVIHPQREEQDKEWQEIEKKVGKFTFWLMRRPVEGKHEAGGRPWEN
ncbi:hypothetical protein F4810DRAFT_706661 [Camillea tinctor]|nr:hypothetical protein F4810DRAFT_706661 [Camillea tinctor]